MFMREKVDEFFGSSGMNVAGGVERKYKCPKCVERKGRPDRDGHLYVHLCGGTCQKCRSSSSKDGSFCCHRCGYRGKLSSLASGDVTSYRPNGAEILGSQEAPRTSTWTQSLCPHTKTITSDLVISKDPPVFKVKEGMEAYRYLQARGLTSWDIEHYNISVGDGELRKRIVFFDLDKEGTPLYWVARDYSGKSPIRYRAPSFEDASRRVQVFNLERLESNAPFIVEGVIDAIRTGRDAIALYGCVPTPEQIRRISSSGIERAYCALDPGAWDRNVDLADKLYRQGVETWLVRIPDGPDPGDLGRAAMLQLKKTAVLYTPKKKLSFLIDSTRAVA